MFLSIIEDPPVITLSNNALSLGYQSIMLYIIHISTKLKDLI